MGATQTVTLVFTDLVGSTELVTRLPPEEADDLRREHFGILREAIQAAGGQEVKLGLPALERRAREAAAAAVP